MRAQSPIRPCSPDCAGQDMRSPLRHRGIPSSAAKQFQRASKRGLLPPSAAGARACIRIASGTTACRRLFPSFSPLQQEGRVDDDKYRTCVVYQRAHHRVQDARHGQEDGRDI